jgi:DHA2 family multidrug resistance protein
MSATASGTAAPAANRGAAANPWLIAVLVAFAAFMEVLDTTIANVALPYIAGGLGVSEDEASWVVTTYLVANAVSLTGSSFFAQRFGRKPFFLICLALFTASSVLCGFAPNLQLLLLFLSCRGSAVAAWCRYRSRFSRARFRRKSAARVSPCSGSLWS